MPSSIAFTIKGNHTSPIGNPMPKAKLTRGQQWTKRAQEYVRWKAYVQSRLVFNPKAGNIKPYLKNLAQGIKPIVLEAGQHAFMVLKIDWHDGHHADPENVFGSVADALFENDKHLDCLTLSRMSPTREGEIRAVVWIFDDEQSKVDFITKMVK